MKSYRWATWFGVCLMLSGMQSSWQQWKKEVNQRINRLEKFTYRGLTLREVDQVLNQEPMETYDPETGEVPEPLHKGSGPGPRPF